MKDKKSIYKIAKHTGFIFLIVLVLSITMLFIRNTFVQPATSKTGGYFVNDMYDKPSMEFSHKETVVQKFSASGDIYGVKIRFHNAGQPQKGSALIELVDEKTGEVLASTQANTETMLNDSYTAIHFDNPYLCNDKKDYILKITPEFENPNAFMRIWQSEENNSIAFGIISYIANAKTIYSFFNIIWILVVFSAIILYTVCFILKLKKETVFIISLLCVSLLVTLILPPYSSPDEEAHINSAYKLANKMEGYKELDFVNETIYKRGEDYSNIFEDKYTSVFSYEYIHNNFFKLSKNNNIVPSSENWVVYDFNGVYTFGALAINIGRMLHLGYVPLMYLGRLFNLLFFALCVYMAIKITPIGKECFMVLSFLPITLHIANSFSRDTFVISLGFLFVAYLLKLINQEEKYTVKQLVLLLVICVLLAPSKFIYSVMCVLILLLGKSKFDFDLKFKSKPVKKLNVVVIAISVLALILFVLYKTNKWVFSVIAASFVNTTPIEILLQTNPDATFNIGLMLQNPMLSFQLILNTIFANGAYYLKSIAGGVLGYNSIYISDAFIFIILALVFVSTCCMPEDKYQLKTRERISFIAVFLMVLALVVYVAITWTPVSYKTIYGIQGKYLMPAMPLLILACKNKIFTITKDIYRPICFMIAITDIYVVLNAFVVILQR